MAQTKQKTIFELIADGLDASVDGRGYDLKHHRAVVLANAAPELLEACKALLADNERAYPADLGNVAAAMARAAITKAEGF